MVRLLRELDWADIMQSRMAMGRCCCGESCIFCTDDFDRGDNTDPTTGAPTGCNWIESGGNGWSIVDNKLVHSGGVESYLYFELGGAAHTWVAQIVFAPPLNHGEFVGFYFGNGSMVVVECEFNAAAGYDALSLVRYETMGGGEQGRWVIADDVSSSSDISMCVTRIREPLEFHYEFSIENAASTYTFSIQEFPTTSPGTVNTCGISAKGNQTVESFLWTDDTGEIDCHTCTPKCDGFDFNETFDDAPLRPAIDDSGRPPDQFNAGRARWTSASGDLVGQNIGNTRVFPFRTFFCKPDFNEVGSFVIEGRFHGFNDGGCSGTKVLTYGIEMLLRREAFDETICSVRLSLTRPTLYVYPDGVAFCEYINNYNISNSQEDTIDLTVNYDDTLRIEITNPTATADAFVIKYYVNAVLQATHSGKSFGEVGVDVRAWLDVWCHTGYWCQSGDASGHYIEIDQWRVFTT